MTKKLLSALFFTLLLLAHERKLYASEETLQKWEKYFYEQFQPQAKTSLQEGDYTSYCRLQKEAFEFTKDNYAALVERSKQVNYYNFPEIISQLALNMGICKKKYNIALETSPPRWGIRIWVPEKLMTKRHDSISFFRVRIKGKCESYGWSGGQLLAFSDDEYECYLDI
jgi:hypothetical protein